MYKLCLFRLQTDLKETISFVTVLAKKYEWKGWLETLVWGWNNDRTNPTEDSADPFQNLIRITLAEAYSGPCQTSMIERFAKIFNGF